MDRFAAPGCSSSRPRFPRNRRPSAGFSARQGGWNGRDLPDLATPTTERDGRALTRVLSNKRLKLAGALVLKEAVCCGPGGAPTSPTHLAPADAAPRALARHSTAHSLIWVPP